MPSAHCQQCAIRFQEGDPDTLVDDVMDHIRDRHLPWWEQLSESQKQEVIRRVRDENDPGSFLDF